ncbi:MAG: NifB/NifX family molybdenum-iron cluster-binding protein [Candidatus Thermoplasmatota archaeon]
MKIGVPSNGEKGLDEKIGEHFGRVPNYTIVDLETDDVKVVPNTSHHMGGRGDPPEIMKNENVDVMICRGLGRKAISLFNQMGIHVYIGAHGTVRDAVKAFKNGELQKADESDACQRHAFRGQGKRGHRV